jgi:hypothetical protein
MKRGIVIIALFLVFLSGKAQTGIGTTTPSPSAKLEVASTDKGLLLPRMTATQRAAIVSPANGLIVYQTDAPTGFFVNTGTSGTPSWTRVNMDWTRTGNDLSYTSGNLSTSGNLTGGNTASSTLSGFSATMNTQTGTSYTLLASDNGKIITFNNASPITLSVPSLFAGFNCMIIQLGAGQVSFSGSGTTITNRSGLTKTGGANAIVTLIGITATTFISGGDLSN